MSTTDLTRAGEILPTVTRETVLSDGDLAALRRAVAALEHPSLAARLSAAAGAPLDLIGRSLPAPVTEAVSRSTEAAMRVALRVALATLPRAALAPASGDALKATTAKAASRLTRILGSGDATHKALAALSGAVGGAFGLTTLAVELPVSTTLMLRSIAEIAREEGEDLETPRGRARLRPGLRPERPDVGRDRGGLCPHGERLLRGARGPGQDPGGGRALCRKQDAPGPVGPGADSVHRADRGALRPRRVAEGRRANRTDPGGVRWARRSTRPS